MENQRAIEDGLDVVTRQILPHVTGDRPDVTEIGRSYVDPERIQGWWEECANRYQPPAVWNVGHVDYRMVGAFEVLFRLPMRVRPKEFGNSMPRYQHEWADFLAQAEGERELKRARNRLVYRHKGATADEVAAMEQALGWPITFLRADREASEAVLLGSMWKAVEADIDRKVARLGIGRRAFFYRRKRGLEAITEGLVAGRVVVT